VDAPPILEIPLPIIFKQPDFGMLSPGVLTAMLKAAEKIGTKMLVDVKDIDGKIRKYANTIIPMFDGEDIKKHISLIKKVQMVELAHREDIEDKIDKVKRINSDVYICVGLPLESDIDYPEEVLKLSGLPHIDTIRVVADDNGRENVREKPRFIKDILRDIHLRLIKASIRQRINILASGGIALAEHVNKSIICGADGVTVDLPLLIAMECRLCGRCQGGLSCPVDFEEMDDSYGRDRIVNLMSAWRNQMLEMLGAMGLREARRLRGEVGRSMWFEDLEKENFAPIFGERKVFFDVG
jgi:hypothetical protein